MSANQPTGYGRFGPQTPYTYQNLSGLPPWALAALQNQSGGGVQQPPQISAPPPGIPAYSVPSGLAPLSRPSISPISFANHWSLNRGYGASPNGQLTGGVQP